MAYLWDSNILRHYSAQHPILFENLKRIERSDIFIPITVYAEQLRGRIEGLLKAEPQHLLLAQKHLKATLELLDDFEVLDLDEGGNRDSKQAQTPNQNSKALCGLCYCRSSYRRTPHSCHQKY